MKQPELGKKIASLRKSRGMTQEELVEKCNLSVRTIQRIEAGEATPRSYTIKTILAALDYKEDLISLNGDSFFLSFIASIRRFFLTDLEGEQPADFVVRRLNVAWFFGMLYFLMGFFEGAAEYFRYEENRMIFGIPGYLIVKTATIVTYVYFQRGFILIGVIYRNYLLKVISLILIFGNILVAGYDMASIFYDSIERPFIIGAEALSFGGMGVLYGFALLKLPHPIRRLSSMAAMFEIITGFFFLTIILGFIGFIVHIPAELLEIVILFKAAEALKTKQREDLSVA